MLGNSSGCGLTLAQPATRLVLAASSGFPASYSCEIRRPIVAVGSIV